MLNLLKRLPHVIKGINWRGIVLLIFFGVVLSWLIPRLDATYPVEDWLLWQLAKIWGYVAILNLAFVSAGYAFLIRCLGLRTLSTKESLMFAASIGVVLYTLVMFVLGALGGFQTSIAFVLAAVFIAIGARDLTHLLVQRRRTPPDSKNGFVSATATVFGLVCLGIMYLQLMTPAALSHDATWCHLSVSQDYAREGRIVPFFADWSRNVPHLASIVHTWGFLMPGLTKQLTWMLALHMEFSLFLWTLLGVVVATEWSTGRKHVQASWAAFFLFPILFVYDSNLAGGADHVLAFFALPATLAAGRFIKRPEVSWGALLGICAGGASLTKYQAIYFLIPIALLIGVRFVYLGLRLLRSSSSRGSSTEWGRLLFPLSVCAVVSIVVVAPHFIKNWIFYSNPIYPFAQEIFPNTHPVVTNGSLYVNQVHKAVAHVPQGTTLEKLWHALQLFVTFSVEPHYSFSKSFPNFGFLFTILLPTILLVPRRRPLLFLLTVGSGAILIWAYTFNVDRNLQTFTPLLVASTSAMLVMLWNLGILARFSVSALVLGQTIWNGDAYFYSGHYRMTAAINLITSGYDGKVQSRLDEYQKDKRAVGEAVPEGGRLLLHTLQANLGMDKEVYLDWSGFQGLIEYRNLHTAREVFDYYQSLGITHVAYLPWHNWTPSKQEEILFAEFARHMKQEHIHGYRLMNITPDQRPPHEEPYRAVLIDSIGYQNGLYDIDQLTTHEWLKPELAHYASPKIPLDPSATILPPNFESVDAVVLGTSSRRQELIRGLGRSFERAGTHKGRFTLYLKRRRTTSPRRAP